MAEFQDIKIVSLDDEASYPSGEGALQNIVLRLNMRAPTHWANYFNEAWRQHIYMMKRRASVSGDRIDIMCMPDELQQHHVPQLKSVIEQTNKAFRAALEQQERANEEAAKREEQRKGELADLKGRLNFD